MPGMQDVTFVFLGGVYNSGPGHWQRIWYEDMPGSVWVEHDDWDHPEREAWVSDLQAAFWQITGPYVVIAHSLGCLLLAEWSRNHDDPSLVGAFLVAVPDPNGASFPASIDGFVDAPSLNLPCPALVIASQDDEYASIDYARALAEHWQAEFVDAGKLGHINANSGIGDWQEGRGLLEKFVDSL
jgi:uncharacterized protein